MARSWGVGSAGTHLWALRPWTVLAIAALAAGVAACGGEGRDGRAAEGAPEIQGVPADPGDILQEDAPLNAPEPGVPQRYTGLFTVLGAPDFKACEGWALPVDGPGSLDLVDLHAGLTPGSQPGEDIFVDVVGVLRDGAGGPFLDVLEVRRATFEGWGCGADETGILLGASGTEPFWSLTVRREGAEWTTPEASVALSHQGLFRLSRGGWGIEGQDAAGRAWRAEFQPGGCNNAMSGAYSHLAAEVTLGGESVRGCAFLGLEAGAGS